MSSIASKFASAVRAFTGQKPEPSRPGKFRESALAHQLLDGLRGLEIGGSAHNAFGLDTRNVDFTQDLTTPFKLEEIRMCGEAMPVDIAAPGDALPVPDASEDFVISSHVLEHFPDPIKALKEWYRVVRKGGYIFMIVPHKERTFDRDRPRTTLAELIARHERGEGLPASTFDEQKPHDADSHFSVWITEDVVALVKHLGWNVVAVQDVDDKVGNGFTVVVRKPLD